MPCYVKGLRAVRGVKNNHFQGFVFFNLKFSQNILEMLFVKKMKKKDKFFSLILTACNPLKHFIPSYKEKINGNV